MKTDELQLSFKQKSSYPIKKGYTFTILNQIASRLLFQIWSPTNGDYLLDGRQLVGALKSGSQPDLQLAFYS